MDWEGFKARIDAVDRSPLWKQPPGPGAGLYRISNADGQVLSTTNSADNDGVQLVLLALDAAQEDDTWRLLPTPEGYYQLVSTRSGLALTPLDTPTARAGSAYTRLVLPRMAKPGVNPWLAVSPR
ncbi:RICIN domain-containing protein [Actinomyces bovis]|uniref:RICIN domain-containing protein n=1 Tax=Actinomyces bovis TaxID=1658 RepID=UPI000DCFB9C1